MIRGARFQALGRFARVARSVWSWLTETTPYGDAWAVFDTVLAGGVIGLVVAMIAIWMLMPRGGI